MHKWAKQIMESVKAKVEAIGLDSFEGQNLDDLKDFTEIAKNIACFDKDYRIVEAMEKLDDDEDIMRMLERYEDYPERRFYDHYRYADGRFAPKGHGTYQRGYMEPVYRMTPEMYRDMDRETRGRMHYTETGIHDDRGTGMHDVRMSESNYDRAKRNYTETKEMHRTNTPQDKEAKMRDLEKYMKELSADITDLMSGMSQEEMNMAKSKLTTLVSKM